MIQHEHDEQHMNSTVPKMDYKVGSRIVCDGYFGTVKFIGAVPPTSGTWFGIEWDDPTRGKHDGSKDGIRYFSTEKPIAGSFVRPHKLEKRYTVYSAILDRYGLIEDKNAGVIEEDMYVVGTNKITTVEVVGAEKLNKRQSKLNQLLEVGLADSLVYGAGPGNELATKCPKIKEMDLSNNLLSFWDDIAEIAKQLPSLESINLSLNKIQLPKDPKSLQKTFSSLKTLYLNNFDYDFDQVLYCGLMWPQIEQLHCCFCRIQQLSFPTDVFQNIKLLNLEGNSMKSWDEVNKLGHLTKLETFIVSDAGITSVHFSGKMCQKTDLFPKVKILLLNRNKINEWRSINEINRLQSLIELGLQKNPLLVGKDHNDCRDQIIARVSQLKIFNRSEVNEKERRGAEIDYLKDHGKEWLAAGGNQDETKNKPSQQFNEDHPRYQELINKYGAAEDSEMEKQSKSLKDNLIAVTIDDPCNPDKKSISKKLPVTMSIQKVKTLVSRLFKLPVEYISLSYTSKKMEGPEIPLDNELRQLSFYSVESGDTIHVKEVLNS